MGPKTKKVVYGGTESLPLRRLNEAEVGFIKNMYNYYDFQKKGLIARHLAGKILVKIGVEPSTISLPWEVPLNDLLMFIDSKLPDADPPLDCSLHTFVRMVGGVEANDNGVRQIRPQGLIDFMTSLDRPAPTYAEANLLLTSMLEYDNVDVDTKVSAPHYSREINSFAKKSNALREFK